MRSKSFTTNPELLLPLLEQLSPKIQTSYADILKIGLKNEEQRQETQMKNFDSNGDFEEERGSSVKKYCILNY